MRRKRMVIALILLLIGSYFGYHYLYQEHRDIQTETTFLETDSEGIVRLFTDSSTPKVLNQTVQITGVITQIEESGITLDDMVHGSFSTLPLEVEVGDEVVVKGRCIGYDDLFEIVKLDQCSIINQPHL